MRTDIRIALAPLVALVILAVVGVQTFGALRDSGTWAAHPRSSGVAAPDPYASLEALMASPPAQAPADLRDPFSYNRAPVVARRAPQRPYVPPPPPKPVLTAIIADNDPRALIRYQDHNYTVKPGDVFTDYRVVSITAEQVVLDHNGESLVLSHPRKGE